MLKKSPVNVGDAGDPRTSTQVQSHGRPLGGGNGNPLQYACLENPTDRGAWRAIAHRVAKNWTRLSNSACTPLKMVLKVRVWPFEGITQFSWVSPKHAFFFFLLCIFLLLFDFLLLICLMSV